MLAKTLCCGTRATHWASLLHHTGSRLRAAWLVPTLSSHICTHKYLQWYVTRWTERRNAFTAKLPESVLSPLLLRGCEVARGFRCCPDPLCVVSNVACVVCFNCMHVPSAPCDGPSHHLKYPNAMYCLAVPTVARAVSARCIQGAAVSAVLAICCAVLLQASANRC